MPCEDAAMSLDAITRPVVTAAPRRTADAGAEPDAAGASSAPAAPPVASPRLRLDPALGVVVMEFRSSPGMPARSIPSEQELAAYRAAAISGAPRPGERMPAPDAD